MKSHISMLLRLLALSMLLFGANLIAQENPDPKENPDENDDTAQSVTEADLAAQARDPTAPVLAFVTRYDYISDFHNLKGADQQQLVLQPIIPWKWGNTMHITRITAAYITDGPDWELLLPPDTNPDPGIPPNNTPSANTTGLADTALVDLMVSATSWGRQGFGAGLILPTASEAALGSEKWSLGPAYVALTTKGSFQGGFLTQWLFSVAGKSDREDINSLTIQPFGGFALKNNWSINASEMAFNYNFKASRWTSLPLGISVEKLIQIGGKNARLFFQYEYNFADNSVAPKNTFRIALVPLL